MIEKVFAIEAEPGVIWDALWSDLSGGEAGAFEVKEAHRPRDLVIEVVLSGVPALLGYHIAATDGATSEVTATLEPRGLRYAVSRILTFNHFNRNFEMLLVQGLSNLKSSVEGTQPEGEVAETEP
ncbi:MAG: hypothetical protein AB7P33_10005 [Dehalococcoidia bacterium]